MFMEKFVPSHNAGEELRSPFLFKNGGLVNGSGQPGTKWDYGRSFHFLSRVLEIASGKSIDKLLVERIIKPLSMSDSGFVFPVDKSYLSGLGIAARSSEGISTCS